MKHAVLTNFPRLIYPLFRRDLGIQIQSGGVTLSGRVAAPGGVKGLPGFAFNAA